MPAFGAFTLTTGGGGASSRRAGHSISITTDSTAPSASVITFPAAAGEYNNTTFNAGCATNGLCGTATDTGSGIAQVQVSIRQGTGDYWNGTAFASAAEVFQTATVTGGTNWALTFPATNFPAEGNYTARVVATDNGGNANSGTSATFTIDRTVPLSGVLALNSVTPAGRAFLNGSTVWYRGVETGGGNFRIRDTVTDNVGGSGPGGSQTNALGGTTTGWTHVPSTVSTPVGGPFDSNTFTWVQNTTSSPTQVVNARDQAGNSLTLPTLTFTDDSATNAPVVTFPVAAASYNTAGWNAGCSTVPGDLCGTADDSAKSGIALVDVSIRQGAGNYWNGASFASAAEVFTAATGTTSWSLGFAGANFPANGTYNLRVRTTDNVGNTAITTLAITIDNTAPVAPSGLASVPVSPANNNDPRFTGTAEALSTVNLYATAACTGGIVATGTAAAFASPGLNPVDIADNSTTSYSATATDAAGNVSACSSSISYVEDSAAPAAPSALTSIPVSPANNNDPRITGTAEALSTVSLYATAACTGGTVATGTAALFAGAGLNPTDIADNSTTSYSATATDAAGNVSACSSSISYVEDSIAPVAPTGLASVPVSPANNNDPRITGTAEALSTVSLYATAACTGGTVATGTAALFAGAGLNPTDIADNSTTSYSATATDAAGNVSACSSAISYVEDSIAPVAPTGLASVPVSPANNNDPRITGTAEALSTVSLYATAACTGGTVATGTAALLAGAGLNPTDIADNSTTPYSARTTDAAGNTSPCSSSISYVEDSTAPTAPTGLGTIPASPANNNDPRITGTAEALSTVNLYAHRRLHRRHRRHRHRRPLRRRRPQPRRHRRQHHHPLLRHHHRPSRQHLHLLHLNQLHRGLPPTPPRSSPSPSPAAPTETPPGATPPAQPPTPAAQACSASRSRSVASPPPSTGTAPPSRTRSRTGAPQPAPPPGHSLSPQPTSPPTATTFSASAQSTTRTTPRPRPRTRSRSTTPRRTRRSARSRATRPTQRRPRSRSLPLRAARPSSASSTAAATAACTSPKSYTGQTQGITHLPRSRDRHRRQRRRNAGLVHLDDRHDRADQRGLLPRSRGHLPHGDLERLLGYRCRHRRRSARERADLDPARLEQPLLERHGLRRRGRELAHRNRHRRLVAHLPCRELPGRRQLHDPRPRDRHRDQRPEHPGLADLHDRHGRAEHHDQRAAERPDQLDRPFLLLHFH